MRAISIRSAAAILFFEITRAMWAQCPPGSPPTIQTVTSPTSTQATSCIQTSGAITVAGSSFVIYHAGTTVYLMPGFDAKAGTSGTAFMASVGPVVTTTSLPIGIVAISYSAILSAVEGSSGGPFQWSAVGLPTGITLASSGAISGTPQSAGIYQVSVIATDIYGNSSPPQSLSLTIAGVAITTTSLPGGTVATSYSQQLSASGGHPYPGPAYQWNVSSGTLPAGLNIAASTGTISGSPSISGSSSFSVTATDSVGSVSSPQPLTITVSGGFGITTQALPSGTTGISYGPVALAASGGSGNYSWSATGLPSCLAISSSGTISGTCQSTSSSTVNVTVVDHSNNGSASRAFPLVIGNSTISITTSSLPDGTVNSAYGPLTMTALGGTGSYTWNASGLPSGLSLSSSGMLSGTPQTSSGSPFPINITATDTAQSSGSRAYQLEIGSTSSGAGYYLSREYIRLGARLIAIENSSIPTPTQPTGTQSGNLNIPYTYSTGGSGSGVQYTFYWGDTTSTVLPVGTTSTAHSWTTGGNYSITAKAMLTINSTISSGASAPLTVTISGGAETVSAPTYISGVQSGASGSTFRIPPGAQYPLQATRCSISLTGVTERPVRGLPKAPPRPVMRGRLWAPIQLRRWRDPSTLLFNLATAVLIR